MEQKKLILDLTKVVPIEEHEGEVPYCGLSISKKLGEIPKEELQRIKERMEKSGLIQDQG